MFKSIFCALILIVCAYMIPSVLYADCAGFYLSEFDPAEYDAIFTATPVYEKKRNNTTIQYLQVKQLYNGAARKTEWVRYVDPELSDDCYPHPSTLGTTELYLVRAENLFSMDYVSLPHAVSKFSSTSREYAGVIKKVRTYRDKNDLGSLAIESVSVSAQKEEIENRIRTLIEEIMLLLEAHKHMEILSK